VTLAGKKPDPALTGYLAPLPGQIEKPAEDARRAAGSQADTIEEQKQPSNQKNDPPWATRTNP
jgi:hypothetical protein